jgi:glutaredoxin 3
MAEVTIYTKPLCPYCADALDLLERKGISFSEIDISGNPEKRAEMIQRSGGRMTVPQIFVGNRHLGGCDDIYALDQRGELDPVLQA